MRTMLACAVLALVVPLSALAAPPAKYRYTGVVGTIAGGPARHITEGDGLRFYFRSWRPDTSYRVCVYKRSTRVQCWNRGTGANDIRDSFVIGNFTTRRYGELSAQWTVDGRVVARWSFFYGIGD